MDKKTSMCNHDLVNTRDKDGGQCFENVVNYASAKSQPLQTLVRKTPSFHQSKHKSQVCPKIVTISEHTCSAHEGEATQIAPTLLDGISVDQPMCWFSM